MTQYIVALFFILATFSAAQANEDSAYAESARLRQYAGGADEGDIVVQPKLNQAQAKKKKQAKPEPSEGF